MCVLCLALFLLAWSPYAVICLWATFGNPSAIPLWMTVIPALFAKSSSFYNPVVYVASNKRFRAAFLQYFCCQHHNVEDNGIALKERHANVHCDM